MKIRKNTQKKFSILVQKDWFFWLSVLVIILLTSGIWFGVHHLGKQTPPLINNNFVEMMPGNGMRGGMGMGSGENLQNMTAEERKEFMQTMQQNNQENKNMQNNRKQGNMENIENN